MNLESRHGWLVCVGLNDDCPLAIWPGPHRHMFRADGSVGIIMEKLDLPDGVYTLGPRDVIRPEPTGDPNRVVYDQ